MKNLSREQVDFLEYACKKEKNVRKKQRLQAIRLLTKGYKRAEVQEIFGISKQALGDWVTRYNKDGLEGLEDKPQPGNHHKLTLKQKQTIRRLITTKTPEELELEGRFWNPQQLARLVNKKFHVLYRSMDSYYRLFAFCGFTYHKPDRVNKRQTVSSKKAFEAKLKKEWRDIAKELGLS